MNPKGRPENLINLRDRTPEERREIARKGAEALNAKKAERRTLAEEIAVALSMPGVQQSVVAAMITAAKQGSVPAFTALRDTVGEKPVDRSEVAAVIDGTLDDRRAAALADLDARLDALRARRDAETDVEPIETA